MGGFRVCKHFRVICCEGRCICNNEIDDEGDCVYGDGIPVGDPLCMCYEAKNEKLEVNMKTYFFTMNQVHKRSFERIAKVTGIIQAENESEAYEKAWALAGSDSRCNTEVYEVNLDEGFFLPFYKSSM